MHEIAQQIARPIGWGGNLPHLRLTEAKQAERARRASCKYERFVKVCIARGCSREEARDIVQEAHMRLFEYQRTTELRDPDSILRRIVINLSINNYHDRQSSPLVSDSIHRLDRRGVLIDPAATPEHALDAEQELESVLRSLGARAPRALQAFVAQRGGYSYEEIGCGFGIKPRTVEKHVATAALEIADLESSPCTSSEKHKKVLEAYRQRIRQHDEAILDAIKDRCRDDYTALAVEPHTGQTPVASVTVVIATNSVDSEPFGQPEKRRKSMDKYSQAIIKKPNEARDGVRRQRAEQSKISHVVKAVEMILLDGKGRTTRELHAELARHGVDVPCDDLPAYLSLHNDRIHSDSKAKGSRGRWGLQPERMRVLQRALEIRHRNGELQSPVEHVALPSRQIVAHIMSADEKIEEAIVDLALDDLRAARQLAEGTQ